MTPDFYSPKSRRFVFILFILISLAFSGTVFGKKKPSAGRGARAQKGKKSSARNRSTSRRGRQVARSSRRGRGGRLSARDVRRQRALVAREQSNAVRAMEKRLRRPLTRRERAAELRRAASRN